MTLRIGSFNTQNLFKRAKALNPEDEADTAAILRDISTFQGLSCV